MHFITLVALKAKMNIISNNVYISRVFFQNKTVFVPFIVSSPNVGELLGILVGGGGEGVEKITFNASKNVCNFSGFV